MSWFHVGDYVRPKGCKETDDNYDVGIVTEELAEGRVRVRWLAAQETFVEHDDNLQSSNALEAGRVLDDNPEVTS